MPAKAQSPFGKPYRLHSTQGGKVTDRTYLGKVQVVLFGFTFCPDVCPTTLSNLTRSLDLLGPRRRDVRILFISVDRERDTIPILRRYVSAFAPETVGLTGSDSEIAGAVSAFRARYLVDKADGHLRISHTGMVYLIDRHGRLYKLLPPSTSPARYDEEMRKLVSLP